MHMLYCIHVITSLMCNFTTSISHVYQKTYYLSFNIQEIKIIISPLIRILPWQPFKTLIMGFKLESLVFCTQ